VSRHYLAKGLKHNTLMNHTAVVSASGFSMLDLSPTAWFKAGTGITDDGTNISDWADESGNSHDATQPSSGNRPLVGTQNSLTILDCVPEDAIEPPNTIGLNGATAGTIIFAANLDASIGAFDCPLAFGGGSDPRFEMASNVGRSIQSQGSLGISLNGDNLWLAPSLGADAIYTITWDGSNWTTYIDGVQDSTDAVNGAFSASTGNPYGIGGSSTVNRGALCKIYEVVYFSGKKLTSGEQSDAEGDISTRLAI